jgi:hypothetical protein
LCHHDYFSTKTSLIIIIRLRRPRQRRQLYSPPRQASPQLQKFARAAADLLGYTYSQPTAVKFKIRVRVRMHKSAGGSFPRLYFRRRRRPPRTSGVESTYGFICCINIFYSTYGFNPASGFNPLKLERRPF